MGCEAEFEIRARAEKKISCPRIPDSRPSAHVLVKFQHPNSNHETNRRCLFRSAEARGNHRGELGILMCCITETEDLQTGRD